jgi:hypothetical protein
MVELEYNALTITNSNHRWVLVRHGHQSAQSEDSHYAKREAVRYAKEMAKQMHALGVEFDHFSSLTHRFPGPTEVEIYFRNSSVDCSAAIKEAHRKAVKVLEKRPPIREEKLRPLVEKDFKGIATIALNARPDDGAFAVTITPKPGHKLDEGEADLLQYRISGSVLASLYCVMRSSASKSHEYGECDWRKENEGPCFDIEAHDVVQETYSQNETEKGLSRLFEQAYDQLIAPPPPPPPPTRHYNTRARRERGF